MNLLPILKLAETALNSAPNHKLIGEYEFQSKTVKTTYDVAAIVATARMQAELDEQCFTVVCVEANPVHGTQHFSGHKAASPEEAEKMAIQETADDWDCGCCDVVVKGVFAGNVSPLDWNDEA